MLLAHFLFWSIVINNEHITSIDIRVQIAIDATLINIALQRSGFLFGWILYNDTPSMT